LGCWTTYAEFQGDDHVDLPAFALGEVEQTPGQVALQHLFLWYSGRGADHVHFEAALSQLAVERFGVDLGAARTNGI